MEAEPELGDLVHVVHLEKLPRAGGREGAGDGPGPTESSVAGVAAQDCRFGDGLGP